MITVIEERPESKADQQAEVAATLHACLDYLRGEAERADLTILAHILSIAALEAAEASRPAVTH